MIQKINNNTISHFCWRNSAYQTGSLIPWWCPFCPFDMRISTSVYRLESWRLLCWMLLPFFPASFWAREKISWCSFVAKPRGFSWLGGVGAQSMWLQFLPHDPSENGLPTDAFFFHEPFISSFVVVLVLVKYVWNPVSPTTDHMAKNEMTISTEDAHETDNAPITVPSCRVKITKFVTEKANI